jgi:AcrR family transcriptional regulator
VLAAAESLFAADGYARTSISEISDQSGVPQTTIYSAFGNKEELFAAALERAQRHWIKESMRGTNREMRGRPADDILLSYFDYMAESVAARPQGLRMMLLAALEAPRGDERCREIVRNVRACAVDGLARFFAGAGLAGGDPESDEARKCARLAMACIDGALVAAPAGATADDLRQMFRLLHNIMKGAYQPAVSP